MDGRSGAAKWGTTLSNVDRHQKTGLGHRRAAAVFERLLNGRTDVAEAVEGDFLIACADASEDRKVVVTDKLGADR